MHWLTYQITRAFCLTAHLFKRPDLARLEIVERELYRLRLRIGDRTVELRNETAARERAEKRVAQLERALSETISNRMTSQCYRAHQGDAQANAAHVSQAPLYRATQAYAATPFSNPSGR